MTSQNKGNSSKFATNSNKDVFRSIGEKSMSTERAARFSDTQEEFLESLAPRQDRNIKGHEEKEESNSSLS